MLVWILIILGIVILDQVTKLLTVHFLEVGESVTVIPGFHLDIGGETWQSPDVFRFTYVQNEGAAFGMLNDHRWVFMVISSVAIVALLIYLWRSRPKSKWACVALSMIIGGGIGNMIDRIYLSYVIDFLDFSLFPTLWKWVFNVADACVCVGGGILFVWCIGSMITERRNGKKTEIANAPSENSDAKEDASQVPNGEQGTEPPDGQV